MRIKAEGDYDAIKALVDEYAVHFDPKLRDQVVARYRKLNVPTYWAGIYSKLTARTTAEGHVQDVEIGYPAGAAEQYLAYGSMFDKSLLPAHKPEKK
jgi:dipeptidyl-peptidase-3